MRDQLEDLSGKQYGDITIEEYLGNKYWRCKCVCGEELKIRKSSLKRYYINYKCAHTQIGKAHKNKEFIDLTGKQFGDYSIQEYLGGTKWKCKCSCGKEDIYESKYIRNNFNDYTCNHKLISKQSSFVDLTGEKFGDLEVLKYVGNRNWLCKCSCGHEMVYGSYYIRTNMKSYECIHTEDYINSHVIDIKDKEFGDIKVIKYIGGGKWTCKCKCGYTFNKESYYIRNNMNNYKCKHIIGKRYGSLTVIEKVAGRLYKCKCDCGNITNVYDYNLTFENTKSCGCVKANTTKPIVDAKEAKEKLIKYEHKYGRKPFMSEVFGILGVSYSTAYNYVKNYNLYEYIENEFRSKAEMEICSLLKSDYITNNTNIIDNNGKNELDIYIPEKKIAIEFNGTYWHSTKFKDKYYHQNKTIACAKQGIRLIHIFEYEWRNNETNKKVKNLISDIFKTEKIYARNTVVNTEYNLNDMKNFLYSNHLQGYINSSINISIRDSNTNEILGVLCIGRPRFSTHYEYEIYRMCFKNGITVVGGLEKMFRYFTDKYKPESIVTYCDICKFTGNSYLKIGFKPANDPITKPGYIWVDPIENIEITRYKSQKKNLISMNLGSDEDTEETIMYRLGYLKIFNSGNLKLEWKKEYSR